MQTLSRMLWRVVHSEPFRASQCKTPQRGTEALRNPREGLRISLISLGNPGWFQPAEAQRGREGSKGETIEMRFLVGMETHSQINPAEPSILWENQPVMSTPEFIDVIREGCCAVKLCFFGGLLHYRLSFIPTGFCPQ